MPDSPLPPTRSNIQETQACFTPVGGNEPPLFSLAPALGFDDFANLSGEDVQFKRFLQQRMGSRGIPSADQIETALAIPRDEDDFHFRATAQQLARDLGTSHSWPAD